MKEKYWFTLIEIIISIFIITIGVLWIYRLINSNMLLLSTSQENLDLKTLELPLKECIKMIWYSNLNLLNTSDKFSVNFWDDLLWCNKSNYNQDYTFSWVNIDNKTYYLYWNIVFKNSNKIKILLDIYSSNWNYLYWSWSNSQNKYLTIYN